MKKEISVLIVDDEQNILNSLNRLFRDEPFGVFLTSSQEQAFEALKKEKIKLVISDHRMPDITGIELLKSVKERYPDIIRILFTGYSDIKIAEEAINKGEVYRFIDKPWDDATLKTTVKEAIQRFDLSERNRQLMVEIKRQNEQLLSLNNKLKNMYEAQKEFTSTVSHELRTPLASIKTLIDVVTSGTAGQLNADQMNFLSKAKANVDRLNRLINDILDLSKLEAGRTQLDIKQQDTNAVIEEVVQVQRPLATERGLYLKTDLAADLPKVAFDTDKMNQVLNNLISNAIKFTDKGGITISTAVNKEGNHISVCVEDTGQGISKQDMPKLFNKFQQLGDAAKRSAGGTGLGLAICQEIICRHGGKIWVNSEPGKGSAFCFLLPIKERRVG